MAISDIVSDEVVPGHLREDPELWSGCISGAFQERDFPRAFVEAGFVAVGYDKWDTAPWRTVEGIEFRSTTITALKPLGTECLDIGQAVIYKGTIEHHPMAFDLDSHHKIETGKIFPVCGNTWCMLGKIQVISNLSGRITAFQAPSCGLL